MEVEVIDHTPEVLEALDGAVERVLTALGMFVADEAADQLEADPRRVDTGRLKGSITSVPVMSEKAVYVGTNVEYAPYVHEGTKRMEPNRFLKNAVVNNLDQIRAYIENELKNA